MIRLDNPPKRATRPNVHAKALENAKPLGMNASAREDKLRTGAMARLDEIPESEEREPAPHLADAQQH